MLEGKDDVFLERHVKVEGDWEKDYEIRSRFVTSQYAKGQSRFRDDVKIEASKVGAVSDRAIFYQNDSKLYLIGNARAWEYDEDRQKHDEISGAKIIHDLKTSKSVVVDHITFDKQKEPEAPRKPAPVPHRTRGVEVKFNEEDGQ